MSGLMHRANNILSGNLAGEKKRSRIASTMVRSRVCVPVGKLQLMCLTHNPKSRYRLV
jgi:hypothetical protein